MSEKQDEIEMNLSKIQKDFLKLVNENPLLVLEALSHNDIIKPLIWNDSLRNGGKLGYRGIARKYDITDKKSRWILQKIQERNGKH